MKRIIFFCFMAAFLWLSTTAEAQPKDKFHAFTEDTGIDSGNERPPATTRGTSGGIRVDLILPFAYQGDPDGGTRCSDIHNDIVNGESVEYLLTAHSFFMYTMVRKYDGEGGVTSCRGVCMDNNRGLGGEVENIPDNMPFMAVEGDCFSPIEKILVPDKYVTENDIHLAISSTEEHAYNIVAQLCSDCMNCVVTMGALEILWWEGTVVVEAGEIPDAEDSEFAVPLIYMGDVACVQTLNCDNWPN